MADIHDRVAQEIVSGLETQEPLWVDALAEKLRGEYGETSSIVLKSGLATAIECGDVQRSQIASLKAKLGTVEYELDEAEEDKIALRHEAERLEAKLGSIETALAAHPVVGVTALGTPEVSALIRSYADTYVDAAVSLGEALVEAEEGN